MNGKGNVGIPQATNAWREPIKNSAISFELGEKINTCLEEKRRIPRDRDTQVRVEDGG